MVEVLVFGWEEESKGQRKERWTRKFGKIWVVPNKTQLCKNKSPHKMCI